MQIFDNIEEEIETYLKENPMASFWEFRNDVYKLSGGETLIPPQYESVFDQIRINSKPR